MPHIHVPEESDRKSAENYAAYSQLAEESGQRIFGVRGKSVLSPYISPPGDIVLDSMHLLYEGVIKSLLDAFFNSKYHSESFFIGRRATLNSIDNLLKKIHVPHVKTWKAHDLRIFFLYVCYPCISSLLIHGASECVFSLTLFSILIHSSTKDQCILNDVKTLLDNFYSHFYAIFPRQMFTINVHLLKHVCEDLK